MAGRGAGVVDAITRGSGNECTHRMHDLDATGDALDDEGEGGEGKSECYAWAPAVWRDTRRGKCVGRPREVVGGERRRCRVRRRAGFMEKMDEGGRKDGT